MTILTRRQQIIDNDLDSQKVRKEVKVPWFKYKITLAGSVSWWSSNYIYTEILYNFINHLVLFCFF